MGNPNYIPKTFIQNALGPIQIYSTLYFRLAHKNSLSYCRKFMMLFGLTNYRRPLPLLSFVLFLNCHSKGNSSTFRRTADRIEINRYLGVTSVVNQDKQMLRNCNSDMLSTLRIRDSKYYESCYSQL